MSGPSGSTIVPVRTLRRREGARSLRALVAPLFAALLMQPMAATASIPPPLALLVLSDDPATESITSAYATLLAANANFLAADGPHVRWQLKTCLKRQEEAAGCISRVLAANPGPVQSAVLLATRRAGDVYEWQCLGADAARSEARERVSIDLKEAMFGPPEIRAAARDTALDCLFDAAADADGRITPRQ